VCRCRWPLVEKDFWQVGQRCTRREVGERGISGGFEGVQLGRGRGSYNVSGTLKFIYFMVNSTAAHYGSLHMISICLPCRHRRTGTVPDIASEASRGFRIIRVTVIEVGKAVTDLPLPKCVVALSPYKSGIGLRAISLLTTPHPACRATVCR
jgi:hypothetical protein